MLFSAVFGVEKRGQKIALDAPFLLGRVDTALVGVLAVTAIYFLIYPAWRAQFFIEIWFTEGWNAYFQDAAAIGGRLYPEPGALTVNNYPPLSFYAIGLLGKIFGDNLFVGRAISLVAVIVVSCEIFCCVRTLVGGIAGPAIGSLWYLAIMCHGFTSYVGADDPQLAGEAIMCGGLALFLARERAGSSVLVPLLIMVVGGFWKHNMIAIPFTAIIWLFMRRGHAAWRPVLLSGFATAGGLAVCAAIFGADFFSNILHPRHYSIDHVIGNIGHLQWSALAMVIWLGWALPTRSTERFPAKWMPVRVKKTRQKKEPEPRSDSIGTERALAAKFTLVHVPIALAACILQWFGDKVFGNAEFDLMIALGIAVGASFETIRTFRYFGVTAAKIAMVSLLTLRLLATDRHEPLLILFDPSFRAQFEANERATYKEVREVAGIEGLVFCSNKIVCRAAGKPFAVDDFKVEEMVATSAISAQDLARLLQKQQITTFKNDPATWGAIDNSLSHAITRHAVR